MPPDTKPNPSKINWVLLLQVNNFSYPGKVTELEKRDQLETNKKKNNEHTQQSS